MVSLITSLLYISFLELNQSPAGGMKFIKLEASTLKPQPLALKLRRRLEFWTRWQGSHSLAIGGALS